MGGCIEAHGTEPGWVVGADGGGDQEEERGAGGTDAECALRADHCGAQVEGVASGAVGNKMSVGVWFDDLGAVALRRNKTLFRRDEPSNQVYKGGGREFREGDACAGAIEADHVLLWAEEADLAVGGFVGFHAFKALGGVVENAGGRVEGEVLVGCYSGR